MSRTINSIEITKLSTAKLISIMNNIPEQHLGEVPFGNFQLELDLVHEVCEHAELTGYTRCYAVHVNGDYAGYMVVMASEMLHHRGQQQSITDSFYIAPAYRSTGAFKALLAYVEQDLRDNNIRFFFLFDRTSLGNG